VRCLIVGGVGILPACVGTISEPGGSGSGGPVDDDATPARVRRLTRSEYAATVNSLVPGSAAAPIDFPEDAIFNGYNNKADHLRVTSVLAQNLWVGAPALAQEAATAILAAPLCMPGPGTDEGCAQLILRDFAKRAYRREADNYEISELLEVYKVGRGTDDYKAGLAAALTVVYQSAAFVYHAELGDTDAPPGMLQMTQDEIAEQLSYLLTGGPADAELAAANLRSSDVRQQQAQRLLAVPENRATLGDFAAQWTETAGLANLTRDVTVYPEWPALRAKMLDESKAFFGAAVLEDNAKLADLLSANWTIADPELAAFYGATSDSGRVTMPAGQRSGLLTQASVLAVHAQAVDPSPIKRGHFVRVRLMCQTVPPPPPKLVITPPPPDPTRTGRERFAGHSSNATCAVCHTLMDPIGFGLENFDAIGRYRDTDNGKTIDASGEINGDTDIDGPFNGPVELAQKLGQSPTAHACFAQNWLEYSMARTFDNGLTSVAQRTAADFLSGKGSVRDLIVGLIGTEAFVARAKPEPEP
jgi:Protein of unknown function (DUF1588)/Protein of unknown function (DUF1592)/Protein of unknown function (DUF1595)/Protein of unknown function (DUF1587)/Protein of unknown function (DUF1585)